MTAFIRTELEGTTEQDPMKPANLVENLILVCFYVLLIFTVVSGKHFNYPAIKNVFIGFSVVMAVLYLGVLIIGFSNYFDTMLSITIAAIFGVIFLVPCCVFDLSGTGRTCCRHIYGLFSYILFFPVYHVLLLIVCFANIDDISWGNRGPTKDGDI